MKPPERAGNQSQEDACYPSYVGKWGQGDRLTECTQKHRIAAGEKKQWYGELIQWPSGHGCVRMEARDRQPGAGSLIAM